MTQRKILVQFDGSNFYNKVKAVAPKVHLTKFDYINFAKFAASSKKVDCCYYVGEIRKFPKNEKSKTLYANQQSLFLNLRKQNITIKLGYLLKDGQSFHEKGVDVQIAVDLVRGAIKNEYSHFIIASSDTDLIPAILTAKQEGKEVTYLAFENFISRAMAANCSSYKIIKKQDILKFSH